MKSTNGKVIYYGLYVIFAYLNLRFIYALPLAVSQNEQRFAHHMKTSWQLTKGKKILESLELVSWL